ncbi:uncharacterized protein FOMMEDRAFT_154653 [Fomitiporia mediterranea MF3/22]|uniref:uncharacterized protein n=1 Tax=Fomitiporia mediterranea (strain MF3/22) TaxID=694068 RepID=UPI0004407E4E|nr:uncharacterized protein FOMMEDRAFT_154653 [Fomitiporia mediterranea MF3/22]EJD03573.1 hypothetical protein FOMMEDRAFT_154653 [Fomitiporia mediterranea MF3/22]
MSSLLLLSPILEDRIPSLSSHFEIKNPRVDANGAMHASLEPSTHSGLIRTATAVAQ